MMNMILTQFSGILISLTAVTLQLHWEKVDLQYSAVTCTFMTFYVNCVEMTSNLH